MIFKKISFAYEYIFYKLYKWSLEVNGKSRFHEIHAVIMLSLTMAMYLFALLGVMYLFSIGPISSNVISNSSDDSGAIFSILFSAVVFGFNFYLLKYRIGFENVIKKFEHEKNNTEKMGTILVTCYVVGSLVLPITLWFLIAVLNS